MLADIEGADPGAGDAIRWLLESCDTGWMVACVTLGEEVADPGVL